VSSESVSEQDHAIDQGQDLSETVLEFKHLQKKYWGRHFWARGYFVASSGNVTDEVILEYIRTQGNVEPTDGGDGFRIEKQ